MAGEQVVLEIRSFAALATLKLWIPRCTARTLEFPRLNGASTHGYVYAAVAGSRRRCRAKRPRPRRYLAATRLTAHRAGTATPPWPRTPSRDYYLPSQLWTAPSRWIGARIACCLRRSAGIALPKLRQAAETAAILCGHETHSHRATAAAVRCVCCARPRQDAGQRRATSGLEIGAGSKSLGNDAKHIRESATRLRTF